MATNANRENYQKTYEELTFTDDFMFCKVMSNNLNLCKELLELVLNCRIRKIELSEEQKRIDLTYDRRGIRLDVYVEDDANTVYDVDMQMRQDNLPKRMRYYQGMIDLNLLNKGTLFKDLKKSYVIFICVFDLKPNGKNLPVYHFKPLCLEDPSIVLEDDTVKVVINAKGSRENLSQEMKAFLDYLVDQTTNSDFTKALDKEVVFARKHEDWSLEYMTMKLKIAEERAEAKEEGRLEGREEGRLEGLEKGQDLLATLIQRLLADNRNNDIKRVVEEPEYRQKLMAEYALC